MGTSIVHRGEVRPAPTTGLVPAVFLAGVGLAWTGLQLGELLGAPMSHDALADGSLPLAAGLGIFGVAWVAMVVAMMLPSSYPVVRAFAASAVGLRDRSTRLTPFVAGYVGVWTLFGFVLFFGDLGIHKVLDSSPTPGAFHAGLISDALIVAGAFQLTERKRRCLSRCRRPPERHGPKGALWSGLRHGLDCLGSGWALMLAVFALGSPEVLWMALFAGVMIYEKGGRHGVLVARVTGGVLLAVSVLAALS